MEVFLDAHRAAPSEIILDLDATDDPLHGHQEGRFFHGYYDGYCYLPLYIFSGEHLLCAKLRHRAPTLQRPYKALGYPFSTAIVFVGSIAFLAAAIAEDPRSGFIAAIFLACCAPAYAWMARSRRLRAVRQLA
jgi:hypothetical protein